MMERMSGRGGLPIRAATPEDWPTLSPLLRVMGRIDSEAGVRARMTRILARDDHVLPVAVAGDGSLVVGYAWAQDHGPNFRSGKGIARLNDLFVAPEHRRPGTGIRLLAAVAGWAADRGVTWLQWQSSSQATPFYARLGLAGDPCPDREHPFYEIDFSGAGWRADPEPG